MADEPNVLAEAPAATPTHEPAPVAAPVDEPTRDGPEPEAETPEVTEPAAEPEGEKPERKKIPGSERLKRRLQLIESDYLNVQRENEELRQRATPPAQQEGRPGIEREPRDTDFPNDYFAYERAKTAWDVRQAVREEVARERQTAQQRNRQELSNERLEAHEENAEVARERIPDFDKVVRSAAEISVKPELAEEILASDKSALLQYYLAKNPDKARELNGMSGRELAREIGRLETRIHLPTAKKATEATPPPAEIRGGAARPVDPVKGPDDMNAYVAWRKKQKAS